ncbi:MAG TPA: hypothetical protein VGM04_05160 [Sphingomicrobium sp.]
MQNVICWVAIFGAVGCFIVYVSVTLKLIPDASEKANKTVKEMAPSTARFEGISAKDFAELVKAIATLVEGLVKAGPALWSLIGSLLFLLIACAAAGTLH